MGKDEANNSSYYYFYFRNNLNKNEQFKDVCFIDDYELILEIDTMLIILPNKEYIEHIC